MQNDRKIELRTITGTSNGIMANNEMEERRKGDLINMNGMQNDLIQGGTT
jgi:hypothetical protein